MNAMLTDVEQLGFDRILVFHFSRINELGEIKKYKIYFECIGKLSNVIFTDEENKILDTLKKFHISENFDRTLFLNILFILLPSKIFFNSSFIFERDIPSIYNILISLYSY